MTFARARARLWWSGGLAAAVLLGGLAWAWYRPIEVAAEVGEQRPPEPGGGFQSSARIEAAPVRRQDLSLRKEATGYLEPWRLVAVAAETSGRVVERLVEEGEWIEAGQLLVRLDDRDRRLEAREAEAEWLKSRAQYAVLYEAEPASEDTPGKEASLAPGAGAGGPEDLYAQGLISKQEWLEARRQAETEALLSGREQGEVRAASTGLAQAEQRLARARLALERTEIRAPFAGRIADLEVEPGQQVAPGEAFLILLDDSRLKVEVDVLEADVVRLREGAPARVRIPALENAELDGEVYTINPRIDPDTGTGRATVTLPNPRGRLLPGLFAYVALEVGRLPGRLVVPAVAVLERQDRRLVFRVEEGRALWTYVEIGARSGDLLEVTDGLDEGDLVAVANHFALAHEAPVEVVE